MTKRLNQSSIATVLSVEQTQANQYTSLANSENFAKTILGGQVLAQALLAAADSVESRSAHSLHAYFLRPGYASEHVDYEVENLRDGNTISSRRVLARQKGEVIFHLSASFHNEENGVAHSCELEGDFPRPFQLLSERRTSLKPASKNAEDLFAERYGIEFLDTAQSHFHSKQKQAPEHAHWFRISEPLSSSLAVQQAALAYISDVRLLATTLLPHPIELFSENLQIASIDHAMWFHSSRFNVNEWMLYKIESPWAGNGRGFAQAQIYTENGELIASIAQEGIVRLRNALLGAK